MLFSDLDKKQSPSNQTISIALCTFNGDKYLLEQLNSILSQTRLPDELIVCDDLSSDKTVEILQSFRSNAPFLVKIFVNESNLGSTKNFEKAISICSGDLIALSDQDDIWSSKKLEVIENHFAHNPTTGMLFTDAEIIDDLSNDLGHTLWNRIGFTEKMQRNFESFSSHDMLNLFLRRHIVTGATVCFKSNLRVSFLPIPKHWVHDAWITVILALNNVQIKLLNMPLIYYRQHQSQQIGARKQNFVMKSFMSIFHGSLIVEYEKDYENLLVFQKTAITITASHDELINEVVDFSRTRVFLINSGLVNAFKIMVMELIKGRYYKYGNGFKSLMKDITTVLGRQRIKD
jgi:glycosyltransferase involved in cell wall biosynthesis